MKAITMTTATTGVPGMTKPPAAVPHTLKELREAAGMTQMQVAERMGLNRQRISHIEAKYPAIRLDVLIRYMQAIDAHIWVAVGGLHVDLDDIGSDKTREATRAYLKEKASGPGLAQMGLRRSAAEELPLQRGETEPGDDDTGGHVDHADTQSDQGDGQESEEA